MAKRKNGKARTSGSALVTVLGAGVVVAGAVQLGLLFAGAAPPQTQYSGPRAPLAAVLEAATLTTSASASEGGENPGYPPKQRDAASPWGCAAFDLDIDTPPAETGGSLSVAVAPRTPARGLVGYRLVAGEATDTLIPDLEYFSSCLETGQPAQSVEAPARRSTAAFPASRWTMDAIDLEVSLASLGGAGEPSRVLVEVIRSRPDASPYVEVLSVREPFGALWFLDHGAQPAGPLSIIGQVYEAPCAGRAEPGAAPQFLRLDFKPDLNGPARMAAAGDGPRRRLLDLAADISAIPAAETALALRACADSGCEAAPESQTLLRTAAAAEYCAAGDATVWRVRADGALVTAGATPDSRYVSTFTALAPLEAPGPMTAAPAYRAPRPGAVGLRGSSDAPYGVAAPVERDGEGWRVRLRLAPPETSVHLLRLVAVDAAGAPLGASRWIHVLAFSPQASGASGVVAQAGQPPAATTAATPAAATAETYADASANGAAPLPNP